MTNPDRTTPPQPIEITDAGNHWRLYNTELDITLVTGKRPSQEFAFNGQDHFLPAMAHEIVLLRAMVKLLEARVNAELMKRL